TSLLTFVASSVSDAPARTYISAVPPLALFSTKALPPSVVLASITQPVSVSLATGGASGWAGAGCGSGWVGAGRCSGWAGGVGACANALTAPASAHAVPIEVIYRSISTPLWRKWLGVAR